MEILTLVALIAIGAYFLKSHDQRRRIALLARHLGNYQIEKLMENLTEGYLRCLGEDDPERRQQIWGVLDATEARLAAQFSNFAAEFARVDAAQARVRPRRWRPCPMRTCCFRARPSTCARPSRSMRAASTR